MRWMGSVAFVAAVALGWASEAKAEQVVDRFEPTKEVELLGLMGVDISTGWVPANSPIQVSFELHVEDDVYAELPGDAVYDWDAETIHFEGDDGAGVFEVDVGAVLDARVRFDLLNNQFESELIGPYDLLAIGDVEFTPYLLPGNDDRPAHVMRMTERSEVFSQSLVDAIIASGEFVVDAAFDIDVALECTSIDVVPQQGNGASVLQELSTETLAAPADGQELTATGQLLCQTRSTVVILLYPTVRISIGLEDFELAPFELPIPVLTDDESSFDFEALELRFDAPADTGSSSGGEDTGDDATSDGGTGGDTAQPGTTTTPDGDTEDADADGEATGGGFGVPEDGCGCRTRTGPESKWLIWLLGLGLVRRVRASRRGDSNNT